MVSEEQFRGYFDSATQKLDGFDELAQDRHVRDIFEAAFLLPVLDRETRATMREIFAELFDHIAYDFEPADPNMITIGDGETEIYRRRV